MLTTPTPPSKSAWETDLKATFTLAVSLSSDCACVGMLMVNRPAAITECMYITFFFMICNLIQ